MRGVAGTFAMLAKTGHEILDPCVGTGLRDLAGILDRNTANDTFEHIGDYCQAQDAWVRCSGPTFHVCTSYERLYRALGGDIYQATVIVSDLAGTLFICRPGMRHIFQETQVKVIENFDIPDIKMTILQACVDANLVHIVLCNYNCVFVHWGEPCGFFQFNQLSCPSNCYAPCGKALVSAVCQVRPVIR